MIPSNQQSDFGPEIRVGKIGVLKVYQISDEELTRLEQGASQSLFLNFAIAVISIATSLLVALFSAPISSDRVFITFVSLTVIGYLAGAVLLLLWWRDRQPIKNLVEEIRSRIPPEGEAQPLAPLEATR